MRTAVDEPLPHGAIASHGRGLRSWEWPNRTGTWLSEGASQPRPPVLLDDACLYGRWSTVFSLSYVLRLVPTAAVSPPYRHGSGGSEAGGEREGERRRDRSRRAGALSPHSRPHWQAREGRRRAGARRRAGVGREGWGGSDVTRFYWSTWRLK
jgi:hypothetical protein